MGEKTEVITKDRFEAVLFDLDGVLTDTAKVDATCWKKMFYAFLKQRATETGEPFQCWKGDAREIWTFVKSHATNSSQ